MAMIRGKGNGLSGGDSFADLGYGSEKAKASKPKTSSKSRKKG